MYMTQRNPPPPPPFITSSSHLIISHLNSRLADNLPPLASQLVIAVGLESKTFPHIISILPISIILSLCVMHLIPQRLSIEMEPTLVGDPDMKR